MLNKSFTFQQRSTTSCYHESNSYSLQFNNLYELLHRETLYIYSQKEREWTKKELKYEEYCGVLIPNVLQESTVEADKVPGLPRNALWVQIDEDKGEYSALAKFLPTMPMRKPHVQPNAIFWVWRSKLTCPQSLYHLQS
jgi:hypothetical protein